MSLCFKYVGAKRTALPLGGIEGGLLFVFHIHRFPFQDIGNLMGSEGYFSLHEFRDIVTAHELTVVVRVSRRQFEGLGPLAVGINVGNERTGIGAVVSAAADDDPAAIARPGMIALGVGRVDFLHGSYFTSLQVK